MMRVVNTNGFVCFDVLNKKNRAIQKIYKQHTFENTNIIGMGYKALKNLVKLISRRGVQDWSYLVSQTPSEPELILKHLHKHEITNVKVFGWGKSLISLSSKRYDDYSR